MKKAALALAFALSLLASSASATSDLPQTMPAPPERPQSGAPQQAEAMPPEEAACRARLKAAGVTFVEHEPLGDPAGCAAPHPLTVSGLPGDVALRPDAVMTCAMAEATANFVTDHAQDVARDSLGSPIVAIDQVSSYVCRPRTSDSGKLSEHAFANALDWGALEFADGRKVEVRTYGKSNPRRAKLIAELRAAACGPFKTVLGPGSDADHADHFHFDLAQRRNGGTWCQ